MVSLRPDRLLPLTSESFPEITPDSSGVVWDVLIVGGGPAGLSAALTLLRARRSVILIDAGEQRNLVSPRMHGFLSRDGVPPAEFLALCHRELEAYEAFIFLRGSVVHCRKEENRFISDTEDKKRVQSHAVLLASGVVDALPPIEGIETFYGRGVHHCPYCDGWEYRDQPVVVYGNDGQAADLAWELKAWSPNVTLIVMRKATLLPRQIARVEQSGVRLIEGTPVRLEGERGSLNKVILSDGSALPANALFFVTEETPRSDLAKMLGCEFDGKYPEAGETFSTSIEGCFAAGNMCKGRNMVIIAAAQGTVAAISVNEYLLEKSPAEGISG